MYEYVDNPDSRAFRNKQGVTKRCRLSWLTTSPHVYEPKCGGRGEYSQLVELRAHGAQMNFGDLTPYLTYGIKFFVFFVFFPALLEMNYSMIRRTSSFIVTDLLSKESPKSDGSEPRTWDLRNAQNFFLKQQLD
jgi:hypothetical protein